MSSHAFLLLLLLFLLFLLPSSLLPPSFSLLPGSLLQLDYVNANVPTELISPSW